MTDPSNAKSSPPRIDRKQLLRFLRQNFAINWHGHHGVPHWARVRVNGLAMAEINGANSHVVELFAFFHDSERINEHIDDGHGTRGAALARQLRGRFFEATDQEMDYLVQACMKHSDGGLIANVTVQTCWDSDRLDLARVGITPNPRYLCTPEARSPQMLEMAIERSFVWRERYARLNPSHKSP